MRTIKSIVKTENISIDQNSSISEAVKIMYQNNEGTVIVLDQNKTVGILTERDVVELLEKKTNMDQPVINVASKKVISININRSVEYALHVLIDNNIRRLIIIDDTGSFIGIVTQEMLMHKLEEDHYRINLKVSEVLLDSTKNIITLPLQSSIKDANSQMYKQKVGSILITDDSEIVGIITERDLVRFSCQLLPMHTSIETVMSTPVVSVNITDTIYEIVTMMQKRHIRRVLVMDENDEPYGVIGIRDIIKNIKGNYSLFIENKLKYTKQVLNTIDDVIFELYTDKNTTLIQWGNDAAIKKYGSDIIDRPLNLLVDDDAWSDILTTHLQKGRINDHKLKIGDHSYKVSCNYYESSLTEQSFHLICKDITEQEKHIAQQEEQWLKRERMELALLGSNDGVWDWNLLDNSLYFSPRWKEMLGYRDTELSNEFSTWEKRVHPDDLETVKLCIEDNIKGKTEYFENTHRLKHKDGSWVWILDRGKTLFDADDKAIRMIGTHTDITKEKNLQLKYAKQAQMIEQIHDCVVSTDLEGVITSWNSGAKRLMRYTSNEVVGKHITMLYKKEDIPTMYDHIGKLMETGKVQTSARLIKKTKELLDVNLSLALLRGEHGEPIGTIGYAQDITRQKQAEDEIKRLNDNLQQEVNRQLKQIREKDKQLLQQSRMAQMGEMISMIAHQWRQPLAAISATSASIELKASMNKLDNETAQQKARDISDFSQHLSSTIDDFRDFFTPNSKKVETYYDELMASVLQIIATSIKNKNIELIQELNCRGRFMANPNEIKQVILNLIKNAEDALIEKQIKNPYIKISTYKENDKHILEVSDNAGGIPKDIIVNIFDPYFSTKHKKEGTGLGLYMSKTIIEEHCSGELSVSNSKEGAVFRIAIDKEDVFGEK